MYTIRNMYLDYVLLTDLVSILANLSQWNKIHSCYVITYTKILDKPEK